MILFTILERLYVGAKRILWRCVRQLTSGAIVVLERCEECARATRYDSDWPEYPDSVIKAVVDMLVNKDDEAEPKELGLKLNEIQVKLDQLIEDVHNIRKDMK